MQDCTVNMPQYACYLNCKANVKSQQEFWNLLISLGSNPFQPLHLNIVHLCAMLGHSRQLPQCECRDKLHEPKPTNLDLAQVLEINNFPLIPTHTHTHWGAGVGVGNINKQFDQIEWKTGSQKHQALSLTT